MDGETAVMIWTARAALAAWAIGSCAVARGLTRPAAIGAARVAWTAACVVLVVHVVAAFALVHGWSHAAAYADTARQTREVVGLGWGGGLWVNYALVAVWIGDAAWWWWGDAMRYGRRSRWITAAVHGFALFMWVNAAVVFVSGWGRWMGVVMCAIVGMGWALVGIGARVRGD